MIRSLPSRPARTPHVTILVALCLLTLPLLAQPVAATTYVRTYEGSSTVIAGSSNDYAFFGTIACNPGPNGITDTGGCVPLFGQGRDHRGDNFTVTIDDRVFDDDTWFLVGVDVNGDRVIRCQNDNGPDACWLGQGEVKGTVPTQVDGDVFRVFPATIRSTGQLCCPTSGATQGTITVAFE